ncbi:polysaccharide biosynthesis protein [Marinobacter adhaerens]|uniref:Polysaccharide biosynthesis protein n=1 Tax=Marinobacter salsuginis TaxID=418719 RepID=A0A5M3PIQ4_9GAMM|nr:MULTISPECIES: polysaccharide biosynthesis protein [Marinobacter]ODM32261.1 polysaccharide biosynthesis protein [Marinobacter adhaerens]GBO82770.1 hypothetical protein MS5N3_02210 [Marinobacter salsuginis]
MDDNKLYNALLKSQQQRKEGKYGDGEANPDDQFRKERPFAGERLQPPNWTRVETETDGYPPSVYDSSVSLGLISNPRPWTKVELRARKIVFPGMADKAVLDAYREIRIQLRNNANNRPSFTVLYSCIGKSECPVRTAFNLAAAFASDSGTSALLVDCDPHNSGLSELVSVPMDEGVTDYILDPKLPIKKIIYPSGVDRLSVIPAGNHPASAVELFSSIRMRDLIEELEGRYPDRCIIINSPPFQESTEARILERFSDQVILGVPFGRLTEDEILESVESFDATKFSGLVFQE